MDGIVSGETVAGAMLDPAPDARALLLAFYPDAEIPPMTHRTAIAGPLAARVNHGAWIVPCECRTTGDTAPGMLAWPSVPLMWCTRCSNAASGGRWRPYAVPGPLERAVIEGVLLARPTPHRNWEPGETVSDLVADNRAHGLGV